MAKSTRTPYNASRWVTKSISSDAILDLKLTGYCIFATAKSEITLTVNFTDNGAYFKIIVKEDTTDGLSVSFPSVKAVLVSDNGAASVVEGFGATITFPAGTKAGSYVDLLCDGSEWYVQGMHAGTDLATIS
jgi:hypothetical protein